MSDQPFYRLAPFIQEFIYRHEWSTLRGVQVDAIHAILDESGHVLIAAGTASGKTEAAFFPILSELTRHPTSSFGVLYIGPLKALINDQFERIEDLLKEVELPVFAWHGDRTQTEKNRAVKQAKGILQITPESLEGLLMNRAGEAARMFSDLRFIIIDEVHAFMGQDRGAQLLCQICRIDRLTGKPARRIGLSATINDYEAAKRWLSAGSNAKTTLVLGKDGGRTLNLAMAHFSYASQEEADNREDLYQLLYRQVRGRKCLIFTNSRSGSEDTVMRLRDEAKRLHEPDIFYVHHGSLSAALRADTERTLREAEGPAVAAATKTLELGIDLGGLERVVQLGAPNTCSSFVQRLGRAGRRGNTAQMRFVTKSVCNPNEGPMEIIPWDLIQNIAIVQLYLEERWVESFQNKPCPYSLLFHQTLSLLTQSEKTPSELARSILTLPIFGEVPQETYKVFLRHLLETDMIERTEDGHLIVGLAGEKLTNSYRFLSVFEDSQGYRVIAKEREIGEIDALPQIDDILQLGGHRWRVDDVDADHRCVFVQPTKARKLTIWRGGSGSLDDRIVKRMREVLREDTQYGYLQDNALAALAKARENARRTGILDGLTSGLGQHFLLHPWLGTRKLNTLSFLFKSELKESLGIYQARPKPFSFELQCEDPANVFLTKLSDALQTLTCEGLDVSGEVLVRDRYDPYVPKELLERAYIRNFLDLDGVKDAIGRFSDA